MKTTQPALGILLLKYSTAAVANAQPMPPKFLRRGATPCHLRRWHIDIENIEMKPGCSNSWKVPSSWSSTPHVESRMFYESSEECCAELFEDGECNLSDFCECGGGGTGTRTQNDGFCGLEGQGANTVADHCDGSPRWHFNMDTKEGCTNSANFPEQWNYPSMARDMLFDTHSACCEKFINRGEPCPVQDVCMRHVRILKADVEEIVEMSANDTGTIPVHIA
mmetsp:Transcript_12721/g.31053  ORF Transcript_12721/g.31053 Transcript_12721/m.31053 type:complete len:222 (+) Transcript_12721:102-767(+)|eukprot:CAMPEP_0181113518 /NCGR_PEP_ID=MMETSP1071-20121207/20390_1 /TAXON_ID=35127 /ORGANISM="Thalassiosira sp., Strain NH16" /LENGTH=221 /DNA_ID=CAMNT_0023197561 /DNA_START=88 /DNA_END=753 /DNA_ORIENTATION=+